MRVAVKTAGVGNKIFFYSEYAYKTCKRSCADAMDAVVIKSKIRPQVPPKFIVIQSVSCTSLNNTSAQSIKSTPGSNVSSELVFSVGSASPDLVQPPSILSQSSMKTVYALASATPKRVGHLPKHEEPQKPSYSFCCCCCY